MKILTVVHDLGPGGTQRAAQNYAIGYARAGYASACLGYAGGGPRAHILADAGVLVFDGASGGTPDETLRQAVAWGPDLVHIHREGSPDPLSGAVLVALSDACPGLSIVETNVFSRADPTPAGKLIDVHLQLSSWCLWKWQQWSAWIRPRPVGVVLPYAADPTSFYRDPEGARRLRQDLGIPSDAVLFGRIGQPDPAKWSPVLFDAFRGVALQSEDAHLVVVGAPESLWRSHVEPLPTAIRERVHAVDFIQGDDALRAAYSAIDVFAHAAAKGESFGMVLVESMLCETPVVTLSRPSRDNSQVEVVGPAEGGIVAASEDSFREAMRFLGEDARLRRRLGSQGRSRVCERYALDVVMGDLLQIVEVVAANSQRAELRGELEAAGVKTHTSTREIRRLLGLVRGRAPVRERVLSWAVHLPFAYQLWSRLRSLPGPRVAGAPGSPPQP